MESFLKSRHCECVCQDCSELTQDRINAICAMNEQDLLQALELERQLEGELEGMSISGALAVGKDQLGAEVVGEMEK